MPLSALRDLAAIGAIALDARDNVTLTRTEIVIDGTVSTEVLRGLARTAPGVDAAFQELEEQPWLPPLAVGEIIRSAVGAEWRESTTTSSGKYVRSWAKACGVRTRLKAPSGTTGDRAHVAASDDSSQQPAGNNTLGLRRNIGCA